MKINFYLPILTTLTLFTIGNLSSIADFSSYLPSLPNLYHYEERWDWSNIKTTDISFPDNFMWGTGDSAFQTEGVETAHGKEIQNSWTAWEEEEIVKNGVMQPRVSLENRAGKACERWTRYPESIQLEKKLNMNAHRFSIEWAKIEPEKGVFDKDAMQHYIDYVQELIENGIEPIPTLFHHTWPLWFNYPNQKTYSTRSARQPAFEDTRNIEDFVEYALYVFNAFEQAGLLKYIRVWLTFNEPVAYALAAYVDGKLPPGKKLDLKLCGTVAKNMLDAHIAVYDAYKKIDPGVAISFAHAMIPIQPYHPWNPLDYIPAKVFDYLINDVALEYFKTGNFYWVNTIGWKDLTLKNIWNKLTTFNFNPSFFSVKHNPNALGKLDFIGVNYYTHTLLKTTFLKMFEQAARPDEILADNYPVPMIKANYPEGFYHSLKKASLLGIPIIVTENGFSATDLLRKDYLEKHLYVMYLARVNGMDIRGYLFWTLEDCFGWNSGKHSRHGIYAVDFNTQKRTFRKGAQYLIDVMRTKCAGECIEQLGHREQPLVVS